jgi:hypothetical protein
MIALYILLPIFILGAISFTCGYFYTKGRDDEFQEQVTKLDYRQSMGELTINTADIETITAQMTVNNEDGGEHATHGYRRYIKDELCREISRHVEAYTEYTVAPLFDRDQTLYTMKLKVLKY